MLVNSGEVRVSVTLALEGTVSGAINEFSFKGLSLQPRRTKDRTILRIKNLILVITGCFFIS
jgi:hypothetical protein